MTRYFEAPSMSGYLLKVRAYFVIKGLLFNKIKVSSCSANGSLDTYVNGRREEEEGEKRRSTRLKGFVRKKKE